MKNFVNVQVEDQQFQESRHSFHVLLAEELEIKFIVIQIYLHFHSTYNRHVFVSVP
jgi:hypothetical protein